MVMFVRSCKLAALKQSFERPSRLCRLRSDRYEENLCFAALTLVMGFAHSDFHWIQNECLENCTKGQNLWLIEINSLA